MTKRQVIRDIAIAWLIFISLFIIIAIEQNLESPWNRITNGLWVIGVVAMIFFMGRGFYRLYKYLGDNKPKN